MTTPVLTAPKRRDVKALTSALADVNVRDRVSVVLRDDRYGLHQVTGTVTTSVAYDGPVLAGVAVGANGKPHPALVALTVLDTQVPAETIATPPLDAVVDGDWPGHASPATDLIDLHDYASLVGDWPGGQTAATHTAPAAPEPGTPVAADQVVHGDLVVATFECRPWGVFTITGHAVALGQNAVMVGGWLLNTDHGMTTYPGARVTGVRLLDADASDGTPPPVAEVVTDTGGVR